MSNRFKNVYFWLGLMGVVSGTLGISPEHLTSWDLLIQEVKMFLGNPYAIVSLFVALIGVIVDPTTQGWKDEKIGGTNFE